VLCTWSLCSIPDPVAAVREIRRVLRPGGRLHFVEHGRSPDAGVRRWQHRLNGLQRRLACGCHLDRDIPALMREGGLEVEQVHTFYARGEPRPFGWTFQGTASKV
jgi:SAM-dependent methyltransferase